MCWDFSDCGRCGKRTQCSACCYCSNQEECNYNGHRYCKSFDTCKQCSEDLCENCWSTLHYCDSECKKIYKINKLKDEIEELNNDDSDD